jgi:hypothetical protein
MARPGFRLHVGAPWTAVAWDDAPGAAGAVVVDTPQGRHRFDFVIAATGLAVDLRRQPELRAIVDHVATWADRYRPPPGEECPALALCPYLGPGYELVAKNPGAASWLGDIHLFNWGATPSNGISAASITGMKFGVPRLVAGLTRGLYLETADAHAAAFPWHESRSE